VGVRVISLRRKNGKTELPNDNVLLEDGDTLVLSGQVATLALAEEKFLKG
jgi:CPA2 family monovalent cation:H+ antiporter-2